MVEGAWRGEDPDKAGQVRAFWETQDPDGHVPNFWFDKLINVV